MRPLHVINTYREVIALRNHSQAIEVQFRQLGLRGENHDLREDDGRRVAAADCTAYAVLSEILGSGLAALERQHRQIRDNLLVCFNVPLTPFQMSE
jgi:hypothetical protein